MSKRIIDTATAATILGVTTKRALSVIREAGIEPIGGGAGRSGYRHDKKVILKLALDRVGNTPIPTQQLPAPKSAPTPAISSVEARLAKVERQIATLSKQVPAIESTTTLALAAKSIPVGDPDSLMSARNYLDHITDGPVTKNMSFLLGGYATRAARRLGIKIDKAGAGAPNVYPVHVLEAAYKEGSADGWRINR